MASKELKNAHKGTKLKLVNSILGMVISFVMFLSSGFAFAWFSMNKRVNTNLFNIQVDKFDAQAEYTIYLFDSKAGSVNYTGKNGDETDPKISALDVPFYDTIFKQRNKYTPVIIRIALSEIRLEEGFVNIKIDRDASLGIPVTGGYFTDLMRFTIVKGTSLYDDDADALYENIDAAFFNLLDEGTYSQDVADNASLFKGPSKVFTTRDYENLSQSYTEGYNYINLSVPFSSSDFVDDVFNMYIYITYDKTLVNTIGEFGNVSTIGQWVDMANDIKQMEISFSSST